MTVAPLVGAWIEIAHIMERGRRHYVAPLVGAWIEIPLSGDRFVRDFVAPLVGAWIEMLWYFALTVKASSLPSWERGLKCIL